MPVRRPTLPASLLLGTLLALLLPAAAHGQSDDATLSVEMLLAPAAPGTVLLGTAPSAVERPGSVADLAVVLAEQTSGLETLPDDVAIEVAPFWLFGNQGLTYATYSGTSSLLDAFRQSLSLSVATSSSETAAGVPSTALGLGTRFSLVRGRVDPLFNDYARRLQDLYAALNTLNDAFLQRYQQRVEADPVVAALEERFVTAPPEARAALEEQIEARQAQIKDAVEAEIRDEVGVDDVRALIQNLRFRRLGWKLDAAGSLVVDFPERSFDDSRISRWGAWLTGGYEGRHLTALGVARYIHDRTFLERSSLDAGIRLLFDDDGRFAFSGEAVYRHLTGDALLDDSWRTAVVLDYRIARNKQLTFTFGRDFDGSTSGNLITALNLLLGFGADRPIR